MWQTGVGAGTPGQFEGRRQQQPTPSGTNPQNLPPPNLSPHTQLSSDLDHNKSVYDSHTDSGFHSGTNLVSSSSIDDQPNSNCSNMPKEDFSSGMNIHSDAPYNKNNPLSSGCLDSGIDVSERFSSMYLSGPQTSEDNLPSQVQEVNPSPYDDFGLSSEDPSSGQLSPSHVAILREIFTRDDDGDT